jgi:serine/threonine protein kinase
MPLAFPEKPKVPELAKDFLRGCLQIAEKDRFSWDQIYLHPYVAAKFTDYIELSRSLERKVNYLLNSLRERVNKLDLKKLFHGLDTSGDRALN